MSIHDGDGMDAPVCPACDKPMSDAYELFPRGDCLVETECGHCGALMLVEQRTSVVYVTRSVQPEATR
jgi:hypothetical protein